MSGPIQILESPTTGLGQLITENRFFVPTHQRDYRWDRDRVQKFYDDLTDAMERKDGSYFVGLMVFMRTEDGRLRVLDGQQRLATTIILLSALRSWFASNFPSDPTGNRIQYDFIGRAEYGETSAEAKMSLNLNNELFFQKFVIDGSPIDTIRAALRKTGQRESNFALLDAIAFLHDRISARAAADADSEASKAYFSALIKYIRDSVTAVRMTVPTEANAFRVFETLNDRGMDLSAVDLLKNYLFGQVHSEAPDGLKHIETRWTQLTGTLQEFDQEDFVKVYWTSRHGLTQLNRVFEEVQKSVKGGAAALDLSVDMLEAAEYYAALYDPDDTVWSPHTDKARELAGNLRVLNSKLVRPVLLSALRKLKPEDMEKLLRVLEVTIVRWQVIGEGRTGTIERSLAKLAQHIWNGQARIRSDFIAAVSDLEVTDDAFKAKFAIAEGIASAKATYLLRRIEMHERGNVKGPAAKELTPPKSVTLEHILPKNAGAEWNEALKADKKLAEMVERLGNLCLLAAPHNKLLSRSGFEAKKPSYAKSDLLTNKQLQNATTWSSDAIAERQSWLAARAPAVWKL